jgi:hypothetical protein
MKWDEVKSNGYGERIRTAYFQDSVKACELVERSGRLALHDSASHEVMATARQIARGVWQARVHQRAVTNQPWRKLPQAETREFAGKGAKDAAINFMLAE